MRFFEIIMYNCTKKRKYIFLFNWERRIFNTIITRFFQNSFFVKFGIGSVEENINSRNRNLFRGKNESLTYARRFSWTDDIFRTTQSAWNILEQALYNF